MKKFSIASFPPSSFIQIRVLVEFAACRNDFVHPGQSTLVHHHATTSRMCEMSKDKRAETRFPRRHRIHSRPAYAFRLIMQQNNFASKFWWALGLLKAKNALTSCGLPHSDLKVENALTSCGLPHLYSKYPTPSLSRLLGILKGLGLADVAVDGG